VSRGGLYGEDVRPLIHPILDRRVPEIVNAEVLDLGVPTDLVVAIVDVIELAPLPGEHVAGQASREDLM